MLDLRQCCFLVLRLNGNSRLYSMISISRRRRKFFLPSRCTYGDREGFEECNEPLFEEKFTSAQAHATERIAVSPDLGRNGNEIARYPVLKDQEVVTLEESFCQYSESGLSKRADGEQPSKACGQLQCIASGPFIFMQHNLASLHTMNFGNRKYAIK